MNDPIERQLAKEAYCKKFCHPGVLCPDSGFCREVDEAFDPVPSAQPEIVRCKECIHWHRKNDLPYCDRIDYGYGYEPDDFCSRAERRIDGM